MFRLFQKAVALQISTHLEKNDLNDVYQSAYKKCHSTETALLRVQNDLLMALDSGGSVLLLMLILVPHSTQVTLPSCYTH